MKAWTRVFAVLVVSESATQRSWCRW